MRIWDTRTRVNSWLDEDRWNVLRAEMATRSDLGQVLPTMTGELRQAARVEQVRRAHAR